MIYIPGWCDQAIIICCCCRHISSQTNDFPERFVWIELVVYNHLTGKSQISFTICIIRPLNQQFGIRFSPFVSRVVVCCIDKYEKYFSVTIPVHDECSFPANSFYTVLYMGFLLLQYLGVWYEIARYDVIFEIGSQCNTANYTILPNAHIRVVNTGVKWVLLQLSDPCRCQHQPVYYTTIHEWLACLHGEVTPTAYSPL